MVFGPLDSNMEKAIISLSQPLKSFILIPKLNLSAPMPNQISKIRVWSEVEKDNFTALPVKGGHSRLMPLKNCVSPTQRDLVRSFVAMV